MRWQRTGGSGEPVSLHHASCFVTVVSGHRTRRVSMLLVPQKRDDMRNKRHPSLDKKTSCLIRHTIGSGSFAGQVMLWSLSDVCVGESQEDRSWVLGDVSHWRIGLLTRTANSMNKRSRINGLSDG